MNKIEDLLEEGHAYWCRLFGYSLRPAAWVTGRFRVLGTYESWGEHEVIEIWTIEEGQRGRKLK